ncbi:MAG TPA: glycosyltransferase, partial [Thermoanaerobaculia bacterium]|nr:glycosyltransferase [Thermoanaerobaculia bacterium]
MNIAYLLEDTDHSGGVRVMLVHADALIARGHRVRLVTKGAPLTWRGSQAEWIYVDDFREYDASGDDFVVGTFWSTVPAAHALAGERAVHLCQGYEGAFSVYASIRDQIDAAYRLPIPKLVVSKSLIGICRRFHDDVTYIGQVVEDEFFRAITPREHEPPRVLVSGQAQADLKGIQDAYGAVAHARWFHQKLDLIRVSPWAPSREEPLDAVQEFHVALTTTEMTRLMHSCDILIGPNHAEEGFGLPAAEAMASGIPCVLTSIPSYLS